MPVRGLVDYMPPEALFPNPMHPASSVTNTFIALVGHYRGRNLQMDDLEFTPDDQIQRVRGTLRSRWTGGGTGSWMSGSKRRACCTVT